MDNRKKRHIKALFCLCLVFISVVVYANKCFASDNWQNIDQNIESKVLQVNVGLKIKLQNNLWVQVADISSKKKYYVFTTSTKDSGYQVVGKGSAFPIFADDKQKTFFVTNKHVLDNARQIKEECEMFYTGAVFYAKNCKTGAMNFQQLLDVINLVNKKGQTRAQSDLYKNTVNAIWDCYDNNLSERADPTRSLFNKYKKLAAIDARASYFLHLQGPVSQPAIEARVYRIAKSQEPDLAILVAELPKEIKNHLMINGCLPLDFKVIENEDIQIAGYPAGGNFSQQDEYRPSFNSGKVTKLKPHVFEFTAEVSKGFSGGPVINKSGKTIGIITQRLLTDNGTVSLNHGMAIKVEELKRFAPLLVENRHNKETMNNAVRIR